MTLLKCVTCPNGNGTIEKDGKLYECMCSTLRRVGASMPPYIRRAIVSKEHINLPIIRKPNAHHYILSSWSDIKAVIKLVMLLNPSRMIKVTSDREIRDVYVGSKSKKALGENSDTEAINTLEDLVVSPYIVIIRTNELSYKNKAAPGAFEEAMSIRIDRDRPVWVINHREKPFGKGSFAWSESVSELLYTGFQYIEIPQINNDISDTSDMSPQASNSIPAGDLNRNTVSPQDLNSKKRKTKLIMDEIDAEEEYFPKREGLKINSSTPSDDESDNPLSMYGSGLSSSKKFKKRS